MSSRSSRPSASPSRTSTAWCVWRAVVVGMLVCGGGGSELGGSRGVCARVACTAYSSRGLRQMVSQQACRPNMWNSRRGCAARPAARGQLARPVLACTCVLRRACHFPAAALPARQVGALRDVLERELTPELKAQLLADSRQEVGRVQEALRSKL